MVTRIEAHHFLRSFYDVGTNVHCCKYQSEGSKLETLRKTNHRDSEDCDDQRNAQNYKVSSVLKIAVFETHSDLAEIEVAPNLDKLNASANLT